MDLYSKESMRKLPISVDNYIKHFKIAWAIEYFPCSNVQDVVLESVKFNLNNLGSWFFRLEPQFNKKKAILYLHRTQKDDGPQNVSVNFRFGLKEGTEEIWFNELHAEFKAGNFESEIFGNLSRYFKNNRAVVLCQMMIATELSNLTELYGDEAKISLMSDFYNLYKTGNLSDFTIEVSGTFMKAHKAILSERSLFFRDLFINQKYIYSSLSLKDVNMNEVNHILAFMYSGHFNTCTIPFPMKLSAYECLVKLRVSNLTELLAPTEINLVSECATETVELTWQLNLFDCRNPDYVSVSPTFDTAIGSVHFIHHPKSLTESDTISVTVETSCLINTVVAAHVYFSILDSQRKIHHQQTSTEVMKLDSAFVTSFKIEQETILNMKSRSPPEDVLTLCFRIETTNYETKDKKLGGPKNYVEADVNFLSFASLLESANFSDFTILAGDQTFRVHKAILASRSNFFHQLFTNYKENSITIVDLRSSTLKVLLSYIYSGQISLDIDIALDLQKASNKYSVTLLKPLLDNYFRSKCNPDDVCELILKADFWNVENAKNLALNFLTSNFDLVQKSKNWKRLAKENKELASEIQSKVSEDHKSFIIKA